MHPKKKSCVVSWLMSFQFLYIDLIHPKRNLLCGHKDECVLLDHPSNDQINFILQLFSTPCTLFQRAIVLSAQ